jgi:hypothetical protein
MPERFSAVEHGTLWSGQLANFTTQQRSRWSRKEKALNHDQPGR